MDDVAAPELSDRRLVIGVGNLDRGDDAVGRIVAQRLRLRQLPGIEVIEDGGEAASLLSRFEGADAVYLVDAALSGAAPGTIRRFDVTTAPLPNARATLSTHGFGLAAAIELARVLHRLPRFCIVYTVELDSCTTGASLTQAVEAAVKELIARLCIEIA
ncbi:MAG: hydrogenase maturation protease [Methylovirgula sp.]